MSLGYYPFGYRPPFLWDVGASEQDITNIMEGIGGSGGYGSLSPPAMGYYGTDDNPDKPEVFHLKTTTLIGGLIMAAIGFGVGTFYAKSSAPIWIGFGIGSLLGIGVGALGGWEQNVKV